LLRLCSEREHADLLLRLRCGRASIRVVEDGAGGERDFGSRLQSAYVGLPERVRTSLPSSFSHTPDNPNTRNYLPSTSPYRPPQSLSSITLLSSLPCSVICFWHFARFVNLSIILSKQTFECGMDAYETQQLVLTS
jgi:hypothetical protein